MNDHSYGSPRAATVLRRQSRTYVPLLLAVLPLVFVFGQLVTRSAGAAPSACPCTVKIDAHDFASGDPLANFTFIVNEDNTKLPNNPLALSNESFSPIVKVGDQALDTVDLPGGRYLISVRSLDHKMWGKHIILPRDAGTVRIDLTTQSAEHPLPLGKLRIFVFEDNAWTNGAPDDDGGEAAGLGGFKVGLEEQTGGEVTVDYNNNPLCGGVCLTEPDGFVEINNLGPATYFADVHPPEGACNGNPDSQWYQTTTIDGGLSLMTPVEEGSDGTGAPGEQLWEGPNNRTAYFFGFVCAPMDFATPGTGEIVGTARNWVEWAPYTTGTYNEPVENPFIALTDTSTDRTVYVGQGDAAGNFDIQNVPEGTYLISIWDEQLSYIMRFTTVTVGDGVTVDVNDTGDDGEVGIGVSRWFGWLSGYVYKDLNGNGMMDPTEPTLGNTDVDQRWRDGSIKESTFTDPSGYYEYPTAEGGALGRWIVAEQGFARFSSFPGASMYDEHTGDVTPSCVVEPPELPANPCIPNSEGGGLLVNQLVLEGHRSTVDWGKRDYPPGTPGQIVGITYFATTRNEFNARFQAHEDYEPAIPDVTVLLESPGPDGLPNTNDDVIVNEYVTDHWQQPEASLDPQDPPGNTFTQNCNPIRDFSGADITSQLTPKIGPNCLEVPLIGTQTKDGKFDGGYAFADYCPENIGGFNRATGLCRNGSDPGDHALVAGNYIVHVIMPKDPADPRDCNPANPNGFKNISNAHGSIPGGGKGCLWRIVREEDVNVDLGNNFGPQIPPPPCNGDNHVLDQSTLVTRSPYFGDPTANAPLCDKHLIVLQNGQNANADFNMIANFRTDPNGEDPNDGRTGDVAEPGRVVGQVFNDIYFERNQQQSPWYGEPRPIGGIPVGIYARVDTVCEGGGTACATPNVATGQEGGVGPVVTYDANNWRLFTTVTTSPDGSFEALLPSTETWNCPIPQGPCPGMYLFKVDDPGTKASPNLNYDPNLLIATTPGEVWPGLTTQLDLPLDPISGTACELPPQSDPAPTPSPKPELLEVSKPYVRSSDSGTARRITIYADFIGEPGAGANSGQVALRDLRTGTLTTLTPGNGVVSWTPGSAKTPDTIVIQVPALSPTFRAGPKHLAIITAKVPGGGPVPAVSGGISTANALTLHVLGGDGPLAYNPTIVEVAAPNSLSGDDKGHELQRAIDTAGPGSLVVLKAGVYSENVLVWKPLKIQGLGPGGIIGAHELNARDPEDPRFNIQGSVIDGRFFAENEAFFDHAVTAHAPYAGVTGNGLTGAYPVLRGADVTYVAKTTTENHDDAGNNGEVDDDSNSPHIFTAPRIDGLGLMNGLGEGAGGIQLMAYINNLRVTDNVLEHNGGVFAGGIGVGQPYRHIMEGSHDVGNRNHGVRLAYDRVIGNGGLTRSGGLGIFNGADDYDVGRSIFCSNFGVEYGAGISHIGLSPGGTIHGNQIYHNDAVDAGAGLAIESEFPVGGGLGQGSGGVDVDRNLFESNYSGDDGGAIFVLDAFNRPINIRNNMIVDNGAADLGGAILLDDSSNVRIINNTISENVTTASGEGSDGLAHGGGLTSEANDSLWQNDPRYVAQYPNADTRPDFSKPTALFNNIFWHNWGLTMSGSGPGATIIFDEVSGFIDFEIHGTTNPADTFTPRFSALTDGQILVTGPLGARAFNPLPLGQGNTIGADPYFFSPFELIRFLAVSGSRLDPQVAAVTITGQDPPVGLNGQDFLGDYHLCPGDVCEDLPQDESGVIVITPDTAAGNTASLILDRGVRCSNTPVPPTLAACTNGGIQAPFGPLGDYDGQYRPMLRTIITPARTHTPWDLGADERNGTRVTLP